MYQFKTVLGTVDNFVSSGRPGNYSSLALYLASTHWMPVVFPSFLKECLQTLLEVSGRLWAGGRRAARRMGL